LYCYGVSSYHINGILVFYSLYHKYCKISKNYIENDITVYYEKTSHGARACCWLALLIMASVKSSKATIVKVSGEFSCVVQRLPAYLEASFYVVLMLVYLTTFILSTVTLRKLSRHQTMQNNNLSIIQRQARIKRMANAMKMVLTSLLLYSFCYLPFAGWQFFKGLSRKSDQTHSTFCYSSYLLKFLEVLLPLVNSCLSPVILLIFLSDFRKGAKRLICGNRDQLKVKPCVIKPRDNSQGANRRYSEQ